MKTTTLILALTFMALATGSVSAAFIGNLDGVSNSSTFGTSTNTASPLYGWTAVTGGIRAHTNGFSNTAMISTSATANYTAEFDTNVALAPLTTYTLSVRVGNHTDLQTGIDYTIEIGYLDGTNTFVQLGDSSGSYDADPTNTVNGEMTPTSNFDTVTLTLDTTATVTTGDVAVRLARTGGGRWAAFDLVTLDATLIPEPASLMLLGVGAGAMLLRRR